MESKKINQLATSVAPQTSDLTIIGDPITGVSKKITLLQIANLFATTGTVSSVAVTETGDALTITGSPITSAGTINIGFAGDATQYVRGDGALADFPTSTGGGSSVSYYLNSSVSQGTIGGVAYREFSKDPIAGAGTDITASTNGYIASYITDANDPALLEVPAGNFNCEFYFSVNSNAHNPYVYAEIYKYDGTTFTLIGSSQSVPEYLTNGTTLSPYYFAIPVTQTTLAITDRIAIRIYVNVDGRTVTLHTENNHLCQVVTTFSKGLTSLNNLTRQVQFLATGTSGTDFNISSSTATHTFNLPVASATNTGKLSSTDWSTFNSKQPAGNYVTLDTTQTITAAKTFSGVNTFSQNPVINGTGTNSAYTILQSDGTNKWRIGNNYASGVNTFDIFAYDNSSTPLSINSNGAMTLSANVTTTGAQFVQNGFYLSNANAGARAFYTLMWGSDNGINFALRNGTGGANFIFQSATGYDYTFPAATGTLALTSNLSAYLPLTGGTLSGQLNSNSNFNAANFFISQGTTQPATSASVGISANLTSGYLDITGYTYGVRIVKSQVGSYGATIATFENNGNITTTGGNTLEGVTNIKPNADYTITQNSVVPFTLVSSGAIVNSLYLTGRKAGFGTATPRTSASGSSNTLDVKGGIYFGSTASESCTINNDDSFICNFDADNNGGTSNFFAIAKGRTGESGGSEYFRVTGSGNVLINSTTDDGSRFQVNGALSTTQGLYLNGTDAFIWQLANSSLRFATNSTERMRITSGGYTKATSTGSYYSSTGTYHEFIANGTSSNTILFRHTGSDPYGLDIAYPSSSPNGGANNFIYCVDSTAQRASIRSDGGLANYQANDVNLSDERTKKDIIPLESYWDKFKAIEIVKFKYKDQTHDDFNIGVIAQQVEAVAPEFVDVDGWDKPQLDEEGNEIVSNEEPLKAIYTADLHHATIKVLQEAMAKIEKLEAEIEQLKNK